MNLSVSLLLAREASTAVYIPRFPSLYNAGLRYLLECYVKNKIRLSVLVRSGVPGDERRYGGPDWDVNWWQANEGHRFHNALEFQDFSSVPKKNAENVMGESVKTVIKQFSQRNEPFTWVVGPNPQPQLEDILVRHSLQRTQSQLVMYRRCAQETEDKERMPWGASVALDILVRHIVREGVRSWVAAWAMGGPPSDIDHWTKIYENALVDCPRYFHMFAAQNGDEVPGWRNRGIGKLLVSYALKAAGTYGQTTAMLKATRLSAPLCLELGFTPFGTVAEHAWKPPGSTGTGGPKDSVDVPAGLPRDSAKGPEPMPRGPRARCPAISPMHSWAWQDCEKQASQEPRRR